MWSVSIDASSHDSSEFRRARGYSAGDQLIVTRNDRASGLLDGDRATVTTLLPDHGALTIHTRYGRDLTLPGTYLADGRLDHAYALTVHKAQGQTSQITLVAAAPTMTRETAYTALSRRRLGNYLYLTPDPDTPTPPTTTPSVPGSPAPPSLRPPTPSTAPAPTSSPPTCRPQTWLLRRAVHRCPGWVAVLELDPSALHPRPARGARRRRPAHGHLHPRPGPSTRAGVVWWDRTQGGGTSATRGRPVPPSTASAGPRSGTSSRPAGWSSSGQPTRPDEALLFLGDDNAGQPVEVVGIEMDDARLRIIHAMPMRRGYRALYKEAKQWPQ